MQLRPKNTHFCAFNDWGHTDYDEYNIDHDYLDHSYLNIDITAASTTTH
jgi:hypothetical protein